MMTKLAKRFLAKNGLRLVRANLDAHSLRRFISSQDIELVIDVGAASGLTVNDWLTLFPRCAVLAFEPRPNAFAVLQEVAASSGGRVQCENLALGDRNGTVEFHVHAEHETSSSLLRRTEHSAELLPFTRQEVTVTCNVATLDSVAKAQEMIGKGRSVLKLDVQGAEEMVIAGAAKSLPSIDFVLSEITFEKLYEGQCDFNRFHELMASNGFKLLGFLEQFHLPDGRPVYADVVYSNIRRFG